SYAFGARCTTAPARVSDRSPASSVNPLKSYRSRRMRLHYRFFRSSDSMKLTRVFALVLAAPLLWPAAARVRGQADALPTPGFHHLHLNSTNPEKAIDWY